MLQIGLCWGLCLTVACLLWLDPVMYGSEPGASLYSAVVQPLGLINLGLPTQELPWEASSRPGSKVTLWACAGCYDLGVRLGCRPPDSVLFLELLGTVLIPRPTYMTL